MAITAVDMNVSIADTSNVTSYTSGSFTPVANRLYICAVAHTDTAPEATVPTVATTTGLNFVQVGSSVAFNSIASNLARLTVFRAMKSSGLSAGTYTPTLADAGTGCAAFLIEFDGVDTSGTDGSGAVLQPTTNAADASANPSVTLGAFSNANNGVFAAMGASGNTASAGTGFTLLPATPLAYSSPVMRMAGEWRADNDTSVDFVNGSAAWGMLALELVAAAVVAGQPTMRRWGGTPYMGGFSPGGRVSGGGSWGM